MNTLTARFYKKFFQFLLIGFSAMVLLAGGQQMVLGNNLHRGPNAVLAQYEGGESGSQTSQPVGDGSTETGSQTSTPIGDGSTETGSQTSTPIGGTTGGGTTPAAPAAPAPAPAPSAPARTMTSSGGECINGRMHWVNRFSDGFVDIDPTANEFCSGSGTNAQIVSAPAQAPAPAQPQGGSNCNPGEWINTCHNSVGTGHTYCVWNASGNIESDCKIETCNLPTKAPPDCVADTASPGNASSQWECERAVARGQNICTDNITFCENTGANQSTIFLKHEGVCNPNSGERDSRGCIFQFTPVSFQSFACGGQPSQPAAPQQPASQAQTCFVCDNTGFADGQGRWRATSCTQQQFGSALACQVDNRSTFGLCKDGGAVAGNICETRQQTPAPPTPPTPPQGGNITVNPTITNTNTNTNTVTVNNPAPTQVVLATTGNVGVATSAGQVLGVKELPKTGLPALAWSALAFIPAGFRIRRFSKVKKDLENHPKFIFEERQFKGGV